MTAAASGESSYTGPGEDDDAAGLAAELVRSHRTGAPANPGIHAIPPDLRSAFDVQMAVVRSLDAPVAGWKFALTPHGSVAAPLLAGTLAEQADVWPGDTRRVTGVEVEIAVRLKADLSPTEACSLDWLHRPDLVEGPIIGMELIGGRYERNASVPFTAFVADNLGSAGFIVGGPAEGDILAALGTTRCRVEIDGKPAFDRIAQHPEGNPFNVLKVALAELRDVVPTLRAGQILTTGSVCGVVSVDEPGLIKATLGTAGELQCRFADHRQSGSLTG